MRNNNAERDDPCGTPYLTSCVILTASSHCTICFLCSRYVLMSVCEFPRSPAFHNFCRSIYTVVYAVKGFRVIYKNS